LRNLLLLNSCPAVLAEQGHLAKFLNQDSLL
jgi:hypothetical protein